jgi:hypothetical protein
MITLGLLFVLFATKSYKNSYTTTAFIVGLSFAFYYAKDCGGMFVENKMSLIAINIVSIVAVIRAILTKEYDRLWK